MATRYWVGGTGTWDSSTTTHWSSSSGGASGASAPGVGDDVVFDSNSGTGTCTPNSTATAQSLTTTGTSIALGHTSGGTITFADVTHGGNVDTTGFSSITNATQLVFASGTTNGGLGWTIKSPSSALWGNTTFSGVGGLYVLASDLHVTSTGSPVVTLTGGTIDIAGHNLFALTVAITGASVRTIKDSVGGGVIQAKGSGAVWTVSGSNATVSLSSSTITLNQPGSTAQTFAGGGVTYGTLSVQTAAVTTITGANTFASITTQAGAALVFTHGVTQTVSTAAGWTVNGSDSSHLVTISSDSAGTQWTLSISSGAVTSSFVSLKDSAATGGATFTASGSTFVSNVTGWRLVATAADNAVASDVGTGTSTHARTGSDSAVATDAITRSLTASRASSDVSTTVDVVVRFQNRAGTDLATSAALATRAQVVSRGAVDTALSNDVAVRSHAVTGTESAFANDVASGVAVYPFPVGTTPVENHDYEVIICDRYGVALGQIVSAVPTQIDWELDGIGAASIDFWIFDPVAMEYLPQTLLPAAIEIQIWRDNVLRWWGLPISATVDEKQVHLSCSGHLWIFANRNFGPVVTQYLQDAGFEQSGAEGALSAAWSGAGEVATILWDAASGRPVAEGQYAMSLLWTGLFPDIESYIFQVVGVSAPATAPLELDLAGYVWWYPLSGYLPYMQKGLVITSVEDGTTNWAQMVSSMPALEWTRLDTTLTIPAGSLRTIVVALEVPIGGGASWDAIRLTGNEQVGSGQYPADVLTIIQRVIAYAQDPTAGKSPMAIGVIGGLTGVNLIRNYQAADNAGILDSLNEFPTIGACDFEIVWDPTGHYRWFEVFSPGKGAVKYNYPLTIDGGAVTAMQGAVDGSTTRTAVRVMGQGSSGPSEDLGYAAFPSYLGGRVASDASVVFQGYAVVMDTPFFLPTDVGKAIYSLHGAWPVGTTITAVISPIECVTSKQSTLSINNETIGVDGVILDSVQSALANQPLSTLAASAEGILYQQLKTQSIPNPKVRADGPAGLFGFITVGDVIPVAASYGWFKTDAQLMRIAKLTLYPPTEELEVGLNTIPL